MWATLRYASEKSYLLMRIDSLGNRIRNATMKCIILMRHQPYTIAGYASMLHLLFTDAYGSVMQKDKSCVSLDFSRFSPVFERAYWTTKPHAWTIAPGILVMHDASTGTENPYSTSLSSFVLSSVGLSVADL